MYVRREAGAAMDGGSTFAQLRNIATDNRKTNDAVRKAPHPNRVTAYTALGKSGSQAMKGPGIQTIELFAGIGLVLVLASIVGAVLKRVVAHGQPNDIVDN